MKKKLSKHLNTIWSNPQGFSIVDLLAMSFTTIFIWAAVVTLLATENHTYKIDTLQTLIQPITIILGGYFLDQTSRRFIDVKFKNVTTEVVEEPIEATSEITHENEIVSRVEESQI